MLPYYRSVSKSDVKILPELTLGSRNLEENSLYALMSFDSLTYSVSKRTKKGISQNPAHYPIASVGVSLSVINYVWGPNGFRGKSGIYYSKNRMPCHEGFPLLSSI